MSSFKPFKKTLIYCGAILVFIGACYAFKFFLSGDERSFMLRNQHLLTFLQLEKRSDAHYILKASTDLDGRKVNSEWSLPYPVYKLDTGDVNHDGKTDILVGVIKATRFFPEPDKRLFIYQLKDHYIRPLWLGSRVAQPLVDFKTCQEKGLKVQTIEKESNGNYLVAMYQWKGFGLKFVRYVKRNISLNEAYSFIQQ